MVRRENQKLIVNIKMNWFFFPQYFVAWTGERLYAVYSIYNNKQQKGKRMGTTVKRKANRFRIKKRQCTREDNDDVQVEVKDKTVRQRMEMRDLFGECGPRVNEHIYFVLDLKGKYRILVHRYEYVYATKLNIKRIIFFNNYHRLSEVMETLNKYLWYLQKENV